MKFYLLLSILLGLCTCGHIYVSDPQLTYQNTKYVSSAQLYFKLETELIQNEVLKLVWPYAFVTSGSVTLSIYSTTQAIPLSTGSATTDSTTQGYLIRVQAKLNAQQWYILRISASVPQSPTAQSYTAPIQMSTYSGMTAVGVITDYLMYDYNTACGFIAVAPAPGALSSVVVSGTETGIAAPSTITENKYFESSYPVYITFLSSGDYEYGGTFQFTITNGFKWTGSCEALSKTCAGDTACTTIQALSATNDYSCTFTDSVITFKRYQNASKLSINHQDSMRLKITVKNPSILATGAVSAQLVSNYANYIYEVLDKPSLFQTAQIILQSENAQFLWGLTQNLAPSKGCPVRIFFTLSTGIAVWNKISLPFQPLLNFPDSVQGFCIIVNVKAVSIINDLSIYTDAGAFGSKIVSCYTDISTAEKYINCSNVGKLSTGTIKYVKFAFIVNTADYDSTKLATFGQITINNQEWNSAITATLSPKNVFDSKKINVMYSPNAVGNSVFDMVATSSHGFVQAATYAAVTTQAAEDTTGRSSIKYTSDETNLFFPITTTYPKQCCAGHNPAVDFYDCGATTANAECADISAGADGTFADSLILKMLANKYAITLKSTDQDISITGESNVYKGVELYPPSSTATGMFGMDKLTAVDSIQTSLCLGLKSNAASQMCSTYSNYVNYTDAKTTLATQYLYNQWFNTADALELHVVCYAGHNVAKTNICGAATNTAMGIMIRNIKFNSGVLGNTLYPQQTELDFIMCFRYADKASTSLGKDDTTALATAGLINAQVINFKAAASEVFTTSGTMFRVGILNYFEDTLTADHAVNYVPTLLRIGGYMQNAEVTTNTGIAFFFDGVNIVIGESKLSATMPLNPTECASPLASGVTCRHYKNKVINTAPTGDLHKDYYPGLNAITIGGSAVAAITEFNYYIPVWIKVPAFSFAFIGLINNHATFPTLTSAYKLFGTVEISSLLSPNLAYNVLNSTAITAATIWATQGVTGTETTKLNSAGDWEIDGTLGAINTYVAAKVVKTADQNKLAYSSSSVVYPSDILTQAVIDASFDSGVDTDHVNDEPANFVIANSAYSASMHFMVHSQIKYWSGDLTWSMTNTTNPFQAKCVDMQINSFYVDATTSSLAYLIICPYEGKFSTTDTLVSTKPTLTIATWTWPDYYGAGASAGLHLRYMWTDRLGNLKAYLAEKKQGSARTACTIGAANQVFALQTLQKKTQIQITPLNTIALSKATASPKSKEQIKIAIEVSGSTSNLLTTQKCLSGLPSIKCSVTKDTNTFNFILSNTDTVNIQTIPNSLITLNFWLSSTGTTDETLTYNAKIFGSLYKKYTLQDGAVATTINDCNGQVAWTSGPKEDRSIKVTDQKSAIMITGARTPFSFTFTTSYVVLDISKFNVNLAYLASANSNLVSNLRCGIYSGNTISHLFDKFSYSTLTAVEFEYKQQDTILDKPTEIGNVNYMFQCYGGEVIETAPSSSSKIYVQNILSSTIADGYGEDQSTNYASLNSVSSTLNANVTLTKTFAQAGQDSTYTFNIKVAAKTETSATNVVTTSIRFKAGSYFYVEFARDISPRFNKLGIIRCYHEGNPTYCKYESERRIAFIARTDLNHNITYGHNFSIVGVQRPFEFTNYKNLYVALVPYLGTFNYLEFHDRTTVQDAATIDQAVTTIPVVYYSQDSTSAIRSTYSFTMHIKLPTGTVLETIPIWVDFPEEFDEAMFLGWTPSCTLKNVKIKDNDVISNFVGSCALNSNRRVKLTITNDTNHTDTKLYALTISGIPTYNYEQPQVNAPTVWFGSATNTTIPIYKTNLGYFNGTSNLKSFTFSEAGKQLLTWDSNIPECYIGTYRCNAKLKVNNLENFFYDIATFTSSGTYSDLFSFNPSILSVQTGKAFTSFEIAPKAATAPGLYQLKWNHEVTTYYSVIPPLYIVALNTQTSINAASSTYEVPNGGRSLPIIFDFAGKMPETDVVVTGEAKSLEVGGTTYITSKYVSFKETQKTLTYTEKYLSSQIQFVVTGQTVTGTNEPEQPSAVISWTLSGTNSKAYTNPSDVTVTVVAAQTGTPELTLNTPDTSNQIGQQEIKAKCSQSGTLYYVVSQDQTSTQIEATKIKTASEDLNILETDIGTVYTNPLRTFYGYYPAPTAQMDYTITIVGKLQSEATHYLRIYCVNQMETASVAKDTTWKQSSNGGKPLISAMKFQSTNNTNGTVIIALSTAQKKEVTCIICQQAKVEKDKVFGTDGIACDEKGTVSTNTTTTTNTTTRILQTANATNATEYFVVMPDLFALSGSLDTVKTTLESNAFSSALAASTTFAGVALNAITCSINSGYPSTPLINSPSVSPSENSITFTWTGANNTDGFVFVGVVEQTNATVEPTALQLKKNSGYSFGAFNKAFYSQNTAVSVTTSPTTKCLDYKYYWVATNEDPDTYEYTTGIKQGTTKTIGCPTFASIINYSIAFSLLIFGMLFA